MTVAAPQRLISAMPAVTLGGTLLTAVGVALVVRQPRV